MLDIYLLFSIYLKIIAIFISSLTHRYMSAGFNSQGKGFSLLMVLTVFFQF